MQGTWTGRSDTKNHKDMGEMLQSQIMKKLKMMCVNKLANVKNLVIPRETSTSSTNSEITSWHKV